MKLHRLRVESFGAIRSAELELGPGLNVLYGPNDLGKSTLAQALRLVLLLPHTSTHGEPYAPWSGGHTPMVELTFETDAQRIWRVRKTFGKGSAGSSLLQESKNGVDFDDRAKARQVDAELRRILGWGIPEPGGAGAGKGLPGSFLATVLLSTQGDVTNLLEANLTDDALATGKERIAAALQAVAQDPLFVKILRSVQDRRDEAFTDGGARKTARGTVFKVASDRLAEARKAREALEKQVTDSAGVEAELAGLAGQRSIAQEALTATTEQVAVLAALVDQARARTTTAAAVQAADARLAAIRKLTTDGAAAVRRAAELAAARPPAEQAVVAAEAEQVRAEAARAALEAVEGTDPAVADTLQRQQLELQRADADARANAARHQLSAIEAVAGAAIAAAQLDGAAQAQRVAADAAAQAAVVADEAVAVARTLVARCELVERALEVRAVAAEVAAIRAQRAEEGALVEALAAARGALDQAKQQRAEIVVPADLAPLRKLHTELASARGALAVGLVVTVSPSGTLDLAVARDGGPSEVQPISSLVEIEATAELQLRIGSVATVRVQGGRREAQARVTELEGRWAREVVPWLESARATDLERLDERRTEAVELDRAIREKSKAILAQEDRLRTYAGLADRAAQAEQRLATAAAALETPLDALENELSGLTAELAKRRRAEAARALDAARTGAERARSAAMLANQRADQLTSEATAAASRSAEAARTLPDGFEAARARATEAHEQAQRAGNEARESLTVLAAAQASRERQTGQQALDAAAAVEKAKTQVGRARDALAKLVGDLRFAEAERDRLAGEVARVDLADAERALAEATACHAALPVPSRAVTEAELVEAKRNRDQAQRKLADVERELQITRGRLMQVGGAVAKDRLAAAVEAHELAERHERELEVEYDAWRLLLDQLRGADAAQASNLGQALAPALSSGFAGVTQRRYDRVQLTASLSTDGVVVGGEVREADRLSIGTREQLSTLYRLALAECLGSTLVLDDQLVQSDGTRMAWFRAVLREKARAFQIVVLTCRPEDYLAGEAEDVRSVDLASCIRRW